MKFWKIASILALVLLAVAIALLITYWSITANATLDEDLLTNSDSSPTVVAYDNSPILAVRKNYSQLYEISPFIKQAFIAIEDTRFYDHDGIDIRRVFGALLSNAKNMEYKEGASTITQQLIKNTHLTNEKTITRKLKEWKLAAALEKKYSKDEILEIYLNKIYFGGGIYGITAASYNYFGKSPNDVTLGEAATLAGVVKSPNNYSPLINLDAATKRRNIVLDAMVKSGYISANSCIEAKSRDIASKNGYTQNNFAAPYHTSALIEAESLIGKLSDNLVISTYYDEALQKNANAKLSATLNSLDCNGLFLSLDNKSRGITAYASNIANINNIARQGGSVLKPFNVYMPALELNLVSPASQILDEPINIGGYSPANYSKSYRGYTSLRNCVAYSLNVPAVKLLNEVGIDSVNNQLSQLGYSLSDTDKNLSLALGTNTVTPIQIVSSYAALANSGLYRKAHFVRSITDKQGNVLYMDSGAYNLGKNSVEYKGLDMNTVSKRVYNEDNSYIMTDMLRSTANYGTASKLKYLGIDIAAKTGTVGDSDGNTDAYCAAYTSSDTFLAWIGNKNDNLLPIKATGGVHPAMLVKNVINSMPNYSPIEFRRPDGVLSVPIDTDLLGSEHIIAYSPYGENELFTRLTAPNAPTEQPPHSIEPKPRHNGFWDRIFDFFS